MSREVKDRVLDFQAGRNCWGHALHASTFQGEQRPGLGGLLDKLRGVRRVSFMVHAPGFVDEGMTAIWTARDGTSRTGTIYRVEPCFNPRDMYTLFVAVASQPPSHQEMKP